MELLVITGIFASFAILSVVFGTDSRDEFDQDPTRATTLRYV